ncbi:hypothetical protein SASPL_145030 [Salvia splendens]|uniref:Disease resistance protein RPM1 n=1 Tax=Salvia splendens TaxID=180675 RepID=A0A8X8WGW6_SALSN|nr:hypothetical protein SASPL_145030 [Salvia splendens]
MLSKSNSFILIPICSICHLRYLALSSNMSILPARFSQLWNRQTLIVNTTSCTLNIKPNIVEFTQLRHFKTNASSNLCKLSKDEKGLLEKLEVLKLKDKDSWDRFGDLVIFRPHFPELRTLKLRNCDQLAGIPSLLRLELCETLLAADSVKRFLEKKQRLLKCKDLSFDLKDMIISF